MFNVTFAMESCRHCSPRGHRSVHRREPGRTSHGLRGVAYMALGLFSLISTRAPALDTATGASSIDEWEAAWTKVLTRHVDDSGRIDFDSWLRSIPSRTHDNSRTSIRVSLSTSMRTTPWQCTGSFRPAFPKVSAA